jgi:hypothetical protein
MENIRQGYLTNGKLVSIDDAEWCEQQFRKYMGKYTTLTCKEMYQIYLKEKPTKQEKQILDIIAEMCGGYSNPYCFRFVR